MVAIEEHSEDFEVVFEVKFPGFPECWGWRGCNALIDESQVLLESIVEHQAVPALQLHVPHLRAWPLLFLTLAQQRNHAEAALEFSSLEVVFDKKAKMATSQLTQSLTRSNSSLQVAEDFFVSPAGQQILYIKFLHDFLLIVTL